MIDRAARVRTEVAAEELVRVVMQTKPEAYRAVAHGLEQMAQGHLLHLYEAKDRASRHTDVEAHNLVQQLVRVLRAAALTSDRTPWYASGTRQEP